MSRHLLLAVLALSGTAAADPPKHDIPDYDGRGNAGADDEPVIVWIPRVVLYPVYLAHEYLLRRPIGWLVRHAEADHWVQSVEEIFKFGENDENLVIPTFLFDFGLLPSVGLYYSGTNFLAHGNSLSVHGATWGPKWIEATAADRYALSTSDSVAARFEYRHSEENLFFGIGPDVVKGNEARYGVAKIEGSLSYRRILGGESSLQLSSGLHHIGFVDGTCCGNPSLDQEIADGAYPAPPGYGETYTTAFASAQVALDSRSKRPAPGSGVYLNTHVTASRDLDHASTWFEYGGVLGGAVDLTGHQRTIRMQLVLDLIDSLKGAPIPFTEYPVLSGSQMPGFVQGWLTGQSTAAAQIGYTWPIWAYLDGQLRFSVGNAFGDHLEGLAPGRFRFSGDIGFSTTTARDQGFEVLFGLGTETIDQGAGITSVRITVGSRSGF